MTYLYYCQTCDTHVDVRKPLADYDREEKCEACGTVMERKITATSFRLIGPGWAKDGYYKPHVTFKMKNGTSQTVPYDTHKLKKEDK